jgi:hypothetical protein
VKGDKGSTEGPALAVRGDVRLELDGDGDDSSAWDSRRRARRRADLKCAGETEDAFWAEEAGRSCDCILPVSCVEKGSVSFREGYRVIRQSTAVERFDDLNL